MLYKLYDPQHQGIMGPRYEHLFRNAALTVMADPAGGTFIDIPKLFRDPTVREAEITTRQRSERAGVLAKGNAAVTTLQRIR